MVSDASPPLFYQGDLTWIPLTLFRFLKQQAQENLQRHIHEVVAHAGIMSDAMKNVTQKQKQIDTFHKLDERIEATEEETTWIQVQKLWRKMIRLGE